MTWELSGDKLQGQALRVLRNLAICPFAELDLRVRKKEKEEKGYRPKLKVRKILDTTPA